MPTHKPAAKKKAAAKKTSQKSEPLLNAVARKLGYAAGTLSHMAQGLAESLPAGRFVPARPAAKRPSKAAAIKTKKTRPSKKAAAARVRAPKTRSVREKAATSSAARSPRKRATKS